MTTAIVPQLPVAAPRADNNVVALSIDRARRFADAAHAKNTRLGYESDLRCFSKWCVSRGFLPLPATPQVVALYATDLAATWKLATVRRHLAAIAFNHREAALENPVGHEVVRRVVRGIARVNGALQTRKSALTIDVLQSVLIEIRGDNLKAKRDRALLLLGFSAALSLPATSTSNVASL
jgi:site-specific recombinase XerD